MGEVVVVVVVVVVAIVIFKVRIIDLYRHRRTPSPSLAHDAERVCCADRQRILHYSRLL